MYLTESTWLRQRFNVLIPVARLSCEISPLKLKHLLPRERQPLQLGGECQNLHTIRLGQP